MVQPLTSSAEGRLIAIVRDLLAELGGQDAVVTLRSSLDRDLGLGSLERVELLMRVEREFGRRLPDQIAQSGDSLGEWLQALEADPAAGDAARKRYDIRQPGPAPEAPKEATNFAQVLRGFAESNPERTQIHLFENDAGLSITYGELYDRSAAVARGLIARGLQPGETVAIMLPTGTDFFYSFFGVMLAGGIAAPIYPPARPKQIEEYVRRQLKILGNARARFLISWERAKLVADVFLAGLPQMQAVVSATELETEGRFSRTALPDPAEIFFLQYTSGSTGNPKGVTLTHGNVLANVRGIGWAVKARPDDRVVSWLPLYHDMGLIGSWLFSVYHGFPITVMSPLDFLSRPERWLWALSDSGGTLCPAPNFSYDLCVRKIDDAALTDVDLSPWRIAINAGEPVLPRTLETFAERFGPYGFRSSSYVPCYGLAESSVALTFPGIDREPIVDVIDREVFEAEGRAVGVAGDRELRFVANGQALPQHEVKVVDEAGAPVGERTRGRILFRGPSRTVGYFANQEATDAVIDSEGWMDSGDLGYLANGELFVTGRIKDCIIKSGHNIIPQDVEAAASDVEGVRKGCIAAFGTVDEKTGTEKMVAVVETRVADEAGRRRIVEEVTSAVAEKVGMPPDHVVLVPALTVPKTSSGKIRRTETRLLYESGKLGQIKQSEPWVQMVHLWTSNLSGWLGLRARDAGSWLRRAYRWTTLAIAAAFVGLPARLIPSVRVQSAAARTALRLVAFLNGARLEGDLQPGDGPQVWLSNRTGGNDAAALAVAVGRGALIAGTAPSNSLLGFLLEPVAVEWNNLAAALESGLDLIVVAESAAGESAHRSRFRLAVFEAAATAGAVLQTVRLDSPDGWPHSGVIRVASAPSIRPLDDPRATRRAVREQMIAL